MNELKYKLIGALTGLVRSIEGNEARLDNKTEDIVVEGLYLSGFENETSDDELKSMIGRVHEQKLVLTQSAAECPRTMDLDMNDLDKEPEEIKNLKMLLLYSAQGIAAFAYQAATYGKKDPYVTSFLYRVLFMMGVELEKEKLLALMGDITVANNTVIRLLEDAEKQV